MEPRSPHAEVRRRGERRGGARQERGNVTLRADDQSEASWGAELRKETREKDGQKGRTRRRKAAYLPGPLRTHSPQRSCVHTSVRPLSLRVSVRLELRPHRQRRFDARPDFVVIVKSGPFDLRPTLAFPSHCADQTRISARLGT